MECAICKIRSSVGYCTECAILVCDSCGIVCGHCQKLVCPTHLHVTRSGRRLCKVCYDNRQSRKAARERQPDVEDEHPGLESTAFDALRGAPPTRGPSAGRREPAAESIEEEALAGSGYKPPPPWQLCLYISLLGFALAFILWALPDLPRVPVPPLGLIKPAVILMVVPAVALLWGIVGLLREKYYQDRFRCVIGIAIALITLALLVHLANRVSESDERGRSSLNPVRDGMSQPDLETWRKQQLQKYQR